ncbi:MAG: PQQ-dependent sugar dehydrogenase [Pyrinomonadaceae bacterium]|nr:PQQ-dependent sugar dehydrogenase [Pyrinomonadaceae bacterium]
MNQILTICLILLTLACSQPPKGLAENAVVTTEADSENGGGAAVKFRIETVAANLEVPWAFAFLPNGNLIFTERPGRVRIIENGKLKAETVFKVPDVEPSSESGLMDVSIHPNFIENRFVYLSYAYRGDGKRVKIVRYKFDGKTFSEPKTIVENLPAAQYHAGTRARFGPDGKLYITTGDATDKKIAQQTASPGGKTLRLNDDGTIPNDNPFVGDKNYRPEIWTLGHRNAQGLAWSPDGLMFQTEHGPSGFDGRGGGDEVNIVERGKNYGWATVSHKETKEGLVSPLLEYTPACAPASGMFYNGAAFPEFKGNFFFGCLRGEKIIRVVLDGRKVVKQEDLLKDVYGRIREMAEAPDGSIYFSTSNRDGRGDAAKDDDKIMRLVPMK